MIKCKIEDFKPDNAKNSEVEVDLVGRPEQLLNECAILTSAVINRIIPDKMPERMKHDLQKILIKEITGGILFYLDQKPTSCVDVSKLKQHLNNYGGRDNDNDKTN